MIKKIEGEKDSLSDHVKQAINLLVNKQISETVVLSSYKINTILKTYFGKEYKIDRIGRALASIAKNKKLKRISTKIPKYELKVSKFKSFQL